MADNVNPSSNNGADWDDWESWDTGSASQSASANTANGAKDDWGDFNSPTPSSDDWGDFDNQSSGQLISQQKDDWELEDSNGSKSGEQSWGTQVSQFDNSDVKNMNPIQEVVPKQVNFGKKTIGFLLAGCLVVLALVFAFFDGIKINKKPNKPVEVNNRPTATVTPDRSQSSGDNSNVTSGSVTLIEIPVTTSLNYSSDVLETSGTVVAKTKYVQAHQVLYCITIRVAFGSSAEDINYYCNFASYNAVKVGELLMIKYQQVDEKYISVNEVLK